MKKSIVLFYLSCILSGLATAQPLQVSVQPLEFQSGDGSGYVEFHFSVTSKKSVDVLVLAKKKEQIVAADRVLLIPPTENPKGSPFVQMIRMALDSGLYTMELRFKNQGAPEDSAQIVSGDMRFSYNLKSQAFFAESLSAAELPNTFDRYGILAIPRAQFGTPLMAGADATALIYSESYGWKVGDKGFARYWIRDEQHQTDLTQWGGQSKLKALEGSTVLPFTCGISLASIPSGLYTFRLQILDEKGDTIDDVRLPFYRITPESEGRALTLASLRNPRWMEAIGTGATAQKAIASHYPIANQAQRKQLDGLLVEAKDSILWLWAESFWIQRTSADPLAGYTEYKMWVVQVEREFSTQAMPGYATDRGRIFLQYGAPTLTEKRPFENDSYPYEIWQYNTLDAENAPYQVNKLFIFANFSVATRGYELLHSDAIGELRNPRWRIMLQKRSYMSNNPDDTGNTQQNGWGSRIGNNIFFNNSSSGGGGN